MSKDIGVLIAMPAELKQRIDARAAQAGLSTQTLMLAYVIQGMTVVPTSTFVEFRETPERRGGSVVLEELHSDEWRGDPNADDQVQPPSNVDVDAMVATRMAEAESAGLAQPPGQPYEAFGPPASLNTFTAASNNGGAPANVRSLRRPPPQFAPANQPHHIRSL